jgi:UDP:flavonoid glycosyltransferase YjiC (YdhE family)
VPVLGVTSNLDQFLNMHFVAAAGAGERLRADALTADAVREAAVRLLDNERYRTSAAALSAAFAKYHPGRILQAALDEACGS